MAGASKEFPAQALPSMDVRSHKCVRAQSQTNALDLLVRAGRKSLPLALPKIALRDWVGSAFSRVSFSLYS